MVSIGFTGDFCPWQRMEEAYLDGSWKERLKSVRPFFNDNDLNVMDLECPLTNQSRSIPKTGPHLKALPQTAEMLSWLKCRLVATANNHFKDYGTEGMNNTWSALKNAGVAWLGSGDSLEQAARVKQLVIQGLRFAFINATENEWTTTHGEEPGCNPLDPVQLYADIQSVREESDFVILILHGGHEHYNLPSPRMKKWYRFMIDAGADAVIGHHTHIISGYEIYKNKPIFYGLGNFCFDWQGMRKQPWNKGMLVKLKFEKDKTPEFELKFVHQNDEQEGVRLLKDEAEQDLMENVQGLNEVIADNNLLAKKYQVYLDQLASVMITRLQPYSNRYLAALHQRKLMPELMGKHKLRLLTNLVQCESHRDVLLYALKNKISS